MTQAGRLAGPVKLVARLSSGPVLLVPSLSAANPDKLAPDLLLGLTANPDKLAPDLLPGLIANPDKLAPDLLATQSQRHFFMDGIF